MKPRPIAASNLILALVAGAGLFTVSAQSQPSSQSAPAATPRTPDGKPDLTGMWANIARGTEGDVGGGFTQAVDESGITRLVPSRRCAPNQPHCHDNTNQNNDGEFTGRTDPNRPVYKPEYWDKVQELDYNTDFVDPMFKCQPLGVPRMGPPTKIVQTPTEMIFFYAGGVGAEHDYRLIPTDGRGHDANAFPTYYGDSVGRWEGDTFVVDVVSFNDITWVGPRGGYFHSYDLHVTERFRRDGDTLHYQATVEDPTVLLQPWVQNPLDLKLNPNPKATIREGLPCHDYDEAITVTRIRH